ncbi:zf-HC2 domain-containing protein [Streptomyces sp. NPDC000618]|uniref:anti-sigma factor family protein n=1 Tax=Streptomyces sp. NPDC000618 TaxID=3154265 RepID=UPI003317C025
MNTRQHPSDETLGAYVLGTLDNDERATLEEHTADCEACRMELAALRDMEAALGEVPPEAFLEGPPEDGELMLQRTLREVRAEQSKGRRRRFVTVGVGVAASSAALFFGGLMVGHSGSTATVASSPPPSPAAGVLVASAVDATTKASMRVQLTPFDDYVKINAAVTGVPGGVRCRLVVVSTDGRRETALSWVIPRNGAQSKLPPVGQGKLEGAAAIDAQQVKEVVVENDLGNKLVRGTPS